MFHSMDSDSGLRQGLSKYLVTGRGCSITWPRDTCSVSEKYLVQKIFNASTCPNCWTLQPHSQVVVLKRPRHSLWPSWWQAQPHSRCSSSTISRTRSSGTWSRANQRWVSRSRDQLSTNHSSPGRAPSGSSSASSSPSSPWFWTTETCDVVIDTLTHIRSADTNSVALCLQI